ncbi:MAG: Asp23/Gls24 family envelope stress response protein [Victivallaceae bacterium]|nr:Asp23/Gls24 family envelope stress response protein [Victivallaceae bacterium]
MRAAKKSVSNESPVAAGAAENSSFGDVCIHENVVAALVKKAALQVEGVSRLAGNTLVDNIAEIVGSRRMQARAITVEMGSDNQVAVEVKLNVKFGFNVPVVARDVQKKVIESVEACTGMNVRKVNVLVQEIEDEPSEGDGEASETPTTSLLS